MNDLVSIIMPSHNTAEYIAEAVQSVLAQTYSNWELLIVDDCSTDSTDLVLEPFLIDSRIKYWKNETNKGAAYSRNKALREAQGKWVTFLDSDDILSSVKLEKQIRFMESNGYHFSYTYFSEMNEDGTPRGILWTGPKKIGIIRMHLFNYMADMTVMYDREFVGLIQVAEIKKRNDYAMWVQVVKKCPSYLLPESLALYRIRSSGSITNRSEFALKRMKYNYEMWRKSEKKNSVTSILLTCINTFFGALKKLQYRKHVAVSLGQEC